MEGGVISETGLSVRLNVVEEPKPDTKNVTILLLHTVVQTVKERTLKLKRVILKNAQVVQFFDIFEATLRYYSNKDPFH